LQICRAPNKLDTIFQQSAVEEKIVQAVIMVAGKSTRTYPLTLTRPKPLLPILNRPLIYYNLDQLVGLVDEIILIVGYRKEMIERELGREYRGIRLIYQEQEEQLGTGHAVLLAERHVKGKCIAMNGDDLFAREDISRLLEFRFAALAMPVANPELYGVYEVNDEGLATNLIEKPRENIGNLANVGCYILDTEMFDELEKTPKSERGEIELTTAILNISRREPFHVLSITGYWLPTGFPWDLLSTQNFMFSRNFEHSIAGTVERGAKLEGPIQLAGDSVIQNGAEVLGPVSIASGCNISSSARIGPYSSLGEGVRIGAGSHIEQSIIMDGSRIGPGSSIAYSVLGEGVILDRDCLLSHTSRDGESVKSRVKDQVVDSGLRHLGATLGDMVVLAQGNRVAAGCKLWPGIHTEADQVIEHDLTAD
jgi:bifunctional UDP-N-acetylglucosamine pyrophosphorylase/glucosamine-1-phosphate N-acetyltransferase